MYPRARGRSAAALGGVRTVSQILFTLRVKRGGEGLTGKQHTSSSIAERKGTSTVPRTSIYATFTAPLAGTASLSAANEHADETECTSNVTSSCLAVGAAVDKPPRLSSDWRAVALCQFNSTISPSILTFRRRQADLIISVSCFSLTFSGKTS